MGRKAAVDERERAALIEREDGELECPACHSLQDKGQRKITKCGTCSQPVAKWERPLTEEEEGA